jgi:hypothetical protein
MRHRAAQQRGRPQVPDIKPGDSRDTAPTEEMAVVVDDCRDNGGDVYQRRVGSSAVKKQSHGQAHGPVGGWSAFPGLGGGGGPVGDQEKKEEEDHEQSLPQARSSMSNPAPLRQPGQKSHEEDESHRSHYRRAAGRDEDAGASRRYQRDRDRTRRTEVAAGQSFEAGCFRMNMARKCREFPEIRGRSYLIGVICLTVRRESRVAERRIGGGEPGERL